MAEGLGTGIAIASEALRGEGASTAVTAPGAAAVAQAHRPLNVPRPRSIEEHQLYINEAQLLLSQKRTSLSVLRTGLGIMTLPASVFTILVATSRSYSAMENLALLIPLAALCAALVVFGAFLIVKSWRRIRRCDHLLQELESRDSLLKQLIAD